MISFFFTKTRTPTNTGSLRTISFFKDTFITYVPTTVQNQNLDSTTFKLVKRTVPQQLSSNRTSHRFAIRINNGPQKKKKKTFFPASCLRVSKVEYRDSIPHSVPPQPTADRKQVSTWASQGSRHGRMVHSNTSSSVTNLLETYLPH